MTLTLGERRALKFAQKQMSSLNRIADRSSPLENPESSWDGFGQETLQGKFKEPDMNPKNILSVSSDPPTIIKQKTCQIGSSNFFNN